MNDELNKKLAEWVGFQLNVNTAKAGAVWWVNPAEYRCRWDEAPDGTRYSHIEFPKSLDACFKWLVPKLLEQLDKDTVKIELKYGRTKGVDWIFRFEDWQPFSYHWAHSETPALALCLAIEKLLGSEGK